MLEVEGRYLGSQKSGQVPFLIILLKYMEGRRRDKTEGNWLDRIFKNEIIHGAQSLLGLEIDIKSTLLSWPTQIYAFQSNRILRCCSLCE